MIILVVLAKIVCSIGLMSFFSDGAFYGGILDNIVMGAIFYSLLSYYIFVLKDSGVVPDFGDGIAGFAISVFLILASPLIPFFLVEWLLGLFLPQEVANIIASILILLVLIAFLARDILKIARLFHKPIEDPNDLTDVSTDPSDTQ